MRARYSAYALDLHDYILQSWHPETRPPNIAVSPGVRWLSLTIKSFEPGTPASDTAVVEFVAKCKVNGRASRLHERSRFLKVEGVWHYLDGLIVTAFPRDTR